MGPIWGSQFSLPTAVYPTAEQCPKQVEFGKRVPLGIDTGQLRDSTAYSNTYLPGLRSAAAKTAQGTSVSRINRKSTASVETSYSSRTSSIFRMLSSAFLSSGKCP